VICLIQYDIFNIQIIFNVCVKTVVCEFIFTTYTV